jgi:hypothetical protein
MPGLEISYTDPRVVRERAGDSTWFVSGLIGECPLSFDPGDDSGEREAALCRRLGDATVLRIDHADDRASRVRMWRGGISSFELHFLRLDDGHVVIADHFRNVICRVPVVQRQPTDAVTIDHFLFRHARGRDTYVGAVHRVGHGESVDLDVCSGRTDQRIFDRLGGRAEPRPAEEYIADLDVALKQVIDRLRTVPGAVTMFSGGMDSTLLQSYLGRDVPALNISVDADGFEFGGAFLEASADALGIRPERVVIPGEDFLRHVEAAIDARCVPPQYPQWATLGEVFTQDHGMFIFAERAGFFAREGGRIPYTARHFARLPRRLFQPVLWPLTKISRPYRLRLLAEQAPLLANDPLSPDGWGVQMPQEYGDRSWAERTFGRPAVRARYAARLAYIDDHVELLPASADRYLRHIEIGSWQDFFSENHSQFRSFAHAHGKSVTDPFASPEVIGAALAVPATERYQDGPQSKYIIERLLRERVPAYPDSAKDPITVPFANDYRSGPLTSVWDRYDIPEFFTGAGRADLLKRPGWPAWNAITWAIWQDRVVRNASLTPLPTSVERSWAVDHDLSDA